MNKTGYLLPFKDMCPAAKMCPAEATLVVMKSLQPFHVFVILYSHLPTTIYIALLCTESLLGRCSLPKSTHSEAIHPLSRICLSIYPNIAGLVLWYVDVFR